MQEGGSRRLRRLLRPRGPALPGLPDDVLLLVLSYLPLTHDSGVRYTCRRLALAGAGGAARSVRVFSSRVNTLKE